MITKLLTLLNESRNSERGAVAAEYAVLLALVAVALVVVIASLTGAITQAFDRVIDLIDG